MTTARSKDPVQQAYEYLRSGSVVGWAFKPGSVRRSSDLGDRHGGHTKFYANCSYTRTAADSDAAVLAAVLIARLAARGVEASFRFMPDGRVLVLLRSPGAYGWYAGPTDLPGCKPGTRVAASTGIPKCILCGLKIAAGDKWVSALSSRDTRVYMHPACMVDVGVAAADAAPFDAATPGSEVAPA